MNITIVGAGLFGATVARLLIEKGHRIRLIEERPVVGGMAHDEMRKGIWVHKHGAHIFHTKSEEIWYFVNQFGKFNNYVHTVFALVDEQYVSFPPNTLTYQQLGTSNEQVVFDKLFSGYSRKQWGGQVHDWAISRIPFRNTLNNIYFSGEYQGIPVNGYTSLIKTMLDGIQVEHRKFTVNDLSSSDLVIYSGSLDELFDYQYGKLEYRSLQFKEYEFSGDSQGCAVINYPSIDVPYTRTIEHKHFYYQECDNTIVSYEYPCADDGTNERYYPILSENNQVLYNQYRNLLPSNVMIGGRLGSYAYLNMTDVIEQAFQLSRQF